jgi:hypothetical protein
MNKNGPFLSIFLAASKKNTQNLQDFVVFLQVIFYTEKLDFSGIKQKTKGPDILPDYIENIFKNHGVDISG